MKPYPKPTKTKKAKPKSIVINNADYWFSLCVRERADWTCEKCGKKYQPWINAKGLPANQALHCSHYIGRANYSVRFDGHNTEAHCYGCHSMFEGNPHVFREWKHKRLGDRLYEILIEKSNDITIGKDARRSKKEISDHYRAEFFKMQEARNNGKVGRIEFQGYY